MLISLSLARIFTQGQVWTIWSETMCWLKEVLRHYSTKRLKYSSKEYKRSRKKGAFLVLGWLGWEKRICRNGGKSRKTLRHATCCCNEMPRLALAMRTIVSHAERATQHALDDVRILGRRFNDRSQIWRRAPGCGQPLPTNPSTTLGILATPTNCRKKIRITRECQKRVSDIFPHDFSIWNYCWRTHTSTQNIQTSITKATSIFWYETVKYICTLCPTQLKRRTFRG